MSDEITTEKVEQGTIITPKGFQVAGIHSGVKRKRKDLGIIYCETLANAAAVYTLNQIQAAPILLTKEKMAQSDQVQAVVVNSGNANACTGEQGMIDARSMQRLTADLLEVEQDHVVVSSTGVIGENMPMEEINAYLPKLKLGKEQKDASAFAESILTTDTFEKHACYKTEVDHKQVTVGGVAKGSGMIEPNMGTMLAFITTDAVIESATLQGLLKEIVDRTFNSITVDGDTSTNDMVLVMASGLAENDPLTENHPDWASFVQTLEQTCISLAQQIARDGEGATKLIEVHVTGAESAEDARKVAKTIVGSSLVKTAIYGADANWGRFIAAIGYSGVPIDPNTIDLTIGSIELIKQSVPCAFSEEEASDYLKNETIQLFVDLNVGHEKATAWGCDLTYEYVRINASYRT